jgi:hypothetical protein
MGSQVLLVQAFLSSHVIGKNWHPSVGLQLSVVQALLSLQTIAVGTQLPEEGSQAIVWHASVAGQVVFTWMQPPWSGERVTPQESAVHAFPSSQDWGVQHD